MVFAIAAFASFAVFAANHARAADAAFTQFVASLWPDAERAGVSRVVFDRATRGLEPDYGLPDLVLPGRKPSAAPPQAEFAQVPADYVKEASIARLAAQGRVLYDRYRAPLDAIERRFGVPASIVLAIWGRETDFGRYRLPHNAIRVLATQAYVGRRKAQFREEFILALKILQEGHVTLDNMRSSWAGAMGLTQFLPSEFYKHAVDFDGDGKRDIWNSVPDALASAAQQLVNKGWQRGERWAYEVRPPAGHDCRLAVPDIKRPLGEWMALGYVLAGARKLTAEERTLEASLLQPEGNAGPAFLTPANYFVLKEYNFSDLYVLFVGHLSDRIEGGGPFTAIWTRRRQMRTADVEDMQQRLAKLGIYSDKIDGKAGMKTRAAVGAFQKGAGIVIDCWPGPATLQVLKAMR